MVLDTATILAQIDNVLARAESDVLHATPGRSDAAETASVSGRVTAIVAAIDRLTPRDHHYREAAHGQVEQYGATNRYALASLLGILRALRADVEAGYMRNLVELVHADVFSDFLEMANELQRAGYRDAAAVIAGSTLEEHLRKLAIRNQIPVEKPDGSPKKADTLNADLAKVPVYNKLVQKSVTAWLDLRNNAAHGKYGEYDDAQVTALIRDVRDFAGRHPA